MKESAIARPVTRRRLLATGVAGGVGLFVGCGSGARSDTGWTFVDDRRRTIRLKKRPTRIVAYTSAAAALHDWGVTPVGVFGDDPREDPSSDARTPDGAGFQRSGARGTRTPDLLGAIQAALGLNMADLQDFREISSYRESRKLSAICGVSREFCHATGSAWQDSRRLGR